MNKDKIAQHVAGILTELGEDITSDALKGTPDRVARYFIEFLTYDPSHNMDALFESAEVDQMVLVKDIPFYSLCEHHMLPIIGTCSVAYIAADKVIGLSKIPRLVQKHAHRLQLQERMANDIAEELNTLLEGTFGVAVYVEASHLCMQMRGIKSQGQMVTSVLTGSFREDKDLRAEFLSLVK